MSGTVQGTHRTGPHRQIEKRLNEAGLSYLSEYEGFPPKRLDIYLPEWHLCVEIDGHRHSKPKDEARDAFLQEQGVLTLRLATRSPAKEWSQESLRQIIWFIEQHAGTAPERIVKWREHQARSSPQS